MSRLCGICNDNNKKNLKLSSVQTQASTSTGTRHVQFFGLWRLCSGTVLKKRIHEEPSNVGRVGCKATSCCGSRSLDPSNWSQDGFNLQGVWQVYTSLHASGAERIEMVDVHTLQVPNLSWCKSWAHWTATSCYLYPWDTHLAKFHFKVVMTCYTYNVN